ncbi:MAG: ABC transporter permease subunit [Verrucomicrobiaceae bacterium]|nr:ABC transporter permease subunit [Verrucomicrobiaceae bacterium]
MFHLRRILALASNTVTQLLRMKVLFFLLAFCVLVVAAGFAFPAVSEAQQLKLLKDVSFGALQAFAVVMAIASTALLLPKDVEDRTLYTILAKPVPRIDYLLGKYLGVIALIAGGLILMDAAFSLVLYIKQTIVIKEAVDWFVHQQQGQADAAGIAAVTADLEKQGLTWSLHTAVWSIFLKAAVLTALALLISTIASSTLFTIITGFAFFVIGHGLGLFRDYFFQGGISRWDYALSAVLSILCPDLGLFDIVDPVLEGHVPSVMAMSTMTGFAVLYIVGYLTVAHLLFVEKEL